MDANTFEISQDAIGKVSIVLQLITAVLGGLSLRIVTNLLRRGFRVIPVDLLFAQRRGLLAMCAIIGMVLRRGTALLLTLGFSHVAIRFLDRLLLPLLISMFWCGAAYAVLILFREYDARMAGKDLLDRRRG